MVAIKKFIKNNKFTLFTILFIILCTFILKWNTIQEPYFWDSLGVTEAGIGLLDNNLAYTSHMETFFHPPLIHYILAIAWKIFGYSIALGHIITLIAGIIGLMYTYLIGKKIRNKHVGIVAVILTFFFPVFFAQLGIVQDGMFLFAVLMATIYYYMCKNITAYVILTTILIYMKEIFLLFLGIVLVYDIIKNTITKKKVKVKQVIYLIFPAILFIPWILSLYLSTGYFWRVDLFHGANSFVNNFFSIGVRYLFYDYTVLQITKTTFVFTISIIVSFFFILKKKEKAIYILFSLIGIAYGALFAYSVELPRYFIPFWPLFFILGADSFYNIKEKFKLPKYSFYILIIIITIISISQYTGERNINGENYINGWALETNLEYQDMIQIHKEAAIYLEQNHKNDTILSIFPFRKEISDPRFGYINKKLNTVNNYTNLKQQKIDIIIHQKEAPGKIPNYFKRNATLIRTFEKNNKIIEIYTNNQQKQ